MNARCMITPPCRVALGEVAALAIWLVQRLPTSMVHVPSQEVNEGPRLRVSGRRRSGNGSVAACRATIVRCGPECQYSRAE
jgi:hypothetical protein